MEILVSKISDNNDSANYYQGVIAYGKAVNGKTYVLRIEPQNLDPHRMRYFVIFRAEQTETKAIFKEDDEMGEGLMFDYYDEAIAGFQDFLELQCTVKDE